MKTCPVCGLHVEDEYLYCWEDGTRLSGLDTVPRLRLRVPDSYELSVDRETTSPTWEREDTISRSVLYCPICAGEFPLTFSACPNDGLPLTSNRISRVTPLKAAPSQMVEQRVTPPINATGIAPFDKPPLSISAPEIPRPENQITTTKAPESLNSGDSHYSQGDIRTSAEKRVSTLWRRVDLAGLVEWSRDTARQSFSDRDAPSAPTGMRIIAGAITVALVMFTLGAIYTIYSRTRRGPGRSRTSTASQNDPRQMESPLIPTPREAREYVEEAAPTTTIPADGQPENPTSILKTRGLIVPRLPPNENLHMEKAPLATRLPARTYDDDPPSAGGRFNAQLVRLRSYPSRSGYRYDLTFTLHEQLGRPIRWERLSVVTHSANGETHAESLPFQYRLAASGALTFTVNVEMPGRSAADWSGRVSCMSVGTDETGRPLRASFGTGLSP